LQNLALFHAGFTQNRFAISAKSIFEISLLLEKIAIDKNVLSRHASDTFSHHLDMKF